MLTDNFGDVFKQHIKPETCEMFLTKSLNRSVTGSMTDMINLAKHMLIEHDCSLEKTTFQLNRTPFKVLNYNYPREQFAELTH